MRRLWIAVVSACACRTSSPAVDHPFMFFVVDRTSGMVLFMGRVTEP